MEAATMFNLLGIKFDRSVQQADSITAIGDAHLGKLEAVICALLGYSSAAHDDIGLSQSIAAN